MKFIALIALTTAIKVQEEGPTVAEIFDHVDANDDGEVTWKEAAKAGKAYAKKNNIKLTKKMIKQAHAAFKAAAGDDHKLTLEELEAAIKEHENVQESEEEDFTADDVLEHCDADNNNKLNYGEAKACLTAAV